MNWTKIDTFLRQPTTILGGATAVGTAVSLALHEISWAVALPILAGALVAIAVPQKPAVQADVQKAVTDGIAAAQTPSPTSGAIITADLVKLASDFPPGTPVVAVAPAVPVVAPTFQVVHPSTVAPAAAPSAPAAA